MRLTHLPPLFVAFSALAGGVASATPSGLWLDVPYIHQEKDGCGSAALAMVLQYWNLHQTAVPAKVSDPVQIRAILDRAVAFNPPQVLNADALFTPMRV